MDLIINLVIVSFVLVALYTTGYYLHRVNKSYKALEISLNDISEDLQDVLNSNSNKNVSLIKKCDDIFSKYDNKINDVWENYRKRLDNNQVYSLVHSKEFFSRENLVNIYTKNRDRIKALPGLLTSWGLLGTFVAILLGLTGIDPNNIATINNLVHGLFAKFISSIVALGCSIVFVFVERGAFSKLREGCIKLQNVLEEMFPTTSTNEILYNMQTNMGMQVDTMNALSQSLAQNSLESIEKMVNMFQKTLTDKTAEQFNDITSTINKLMNMMDKLYDTQEEFLDRMESVNRNSETLIEQHKNTLEDLSDTVDKVSKKVKIFKDTIENIENAFNGLSTAAQDINAAGNMFATTIPTLEQNNKSIKELTDNLDKSISYFKGVTNEISASKLDEMIAHFKDGIKSSLIDIQKGLNDDLEIIKDGYKWHKEQLDKLVDTTTTNINSIHNSMNNYTEKTSSFISLYDDSIANATNHLKSNIVSMDESLKQNLKNLEGNFEDLNNTLRRINDNIGNGEK